MWQQRLTAALQSWSADDVEILTLAPLTATDIRAAASTELHDVDEFVQATETAGGRVLAAWPITLKLLLAAARRGSLPERQRDVYNAGVEVLAAERGRRKERRQDGPTLARRIAAATTIAAVTLLSGRSVVVRRAEPGTSNNMVELDRLDAVGVSQEELDAAFDSALFVGEGNSRRWIHRSIEEYLCARALSDIPTNAALRLLTDPAYPGELLPQVADTATWLAALNSDVFDWLTEHCPSALLTPDLHGRPAPEKKCVLKALIARLKDGEPNTRRSAYKALKYPGLASDLEPLLDPAEPLWRRQEAMYIIAMTGVRDLDDQLISAVAEAATRQGYDADVELAGTAAWALEGVTDRSIIGQLRIVLADTSCPWPLRLALAPTLWPGHLTTAELLHALRDLTSSTVRGRLAGMFSRGFREGDVKAHDLAPWLAHLPYMDYYDRTAGRLATAILVEAVRSGEPSGEGWKSAISAVTTRMEVLRTLETADVGALPDDRRQLFAHEALRAVNPEQRVHELAARLDQSGFFQAADLEWWIEKLSEAPEEPLDNHPATAALWRLAWTTELDLPRNDLPDAAATILKEIFGEAVQARREETRRVNTQPEPLAQRSDEANRFSAERFSHLLAAGKFEPLREELDLDLDRSGSNWPVRAWDALDHDQRLLVARVAKRYLLGNPADSARIGDLAVTAHAILDAAAPDMLDEVPAETWLTLLPKLLRTPAGDTAAMAAALRALPHDADATTCVLIAKLREDAEAGFITLLGAQRQLALRGLGAEALTLAANLSMDRALTSLLVLAGRTAPSAAADLAARAIRDGGPRAVAAAAALTTPELSAYGFDDLLEAFQQDGSFATEVIHEADRNAEWQAWSALTVEQAAGLYQWANTALPKPQPIPPGVVVNAHDPVGDFRQVMLRCVVAAGTEEAAILLDDLAQQTGNIWLQAAAKELRETVRASGWSPPRPEEVLELIADPRKRVITTTAQLTELVLDALDELNDDLCKDRGLLTTFWNEERQRGKLTGHFWPVDENAMSTRLARELETRLKGRVVLSREVEVQPHLGNAKADRPDLLAVATTPHATLKLPIEVKGNWHDEVRTAIETQLADRYLQGPSGAEGIYLVGFFASDRWSDHDPRRRAKARKETRTGLERVLQAKAADIADRGITVHVRLLDLSLA
ncbi:hypothetical protein [Kribbella rubisoli]|uniref:hypothetical protein n=1 Tax=Kribbella rubisoli TaxID=3075929 RepID=UPI00102B77E3|nr:hypothetical protein [Kribbella rubisoli]